MIYGISSSQNEQQQKKGREMQTIESNLLAPQL